MIIYMHIWLKKEHGKKTQLFYKMYLLHLQKSRLIIKKLLAPERDVYFQFPVLPCKAGSTLGHMPQNADISDRLQQLGEGGI